jgi:molecular chaperone HscA
LSDTEIETMLRDAMQHAQEDIDARNLHEQLVEAQRVIDALQQALQQDGEKYLSDDERLQLQHGVQRLRDAMSQADHRKIKQAIDALNQQSTEFAARRMNASIQKAMAGHKVDDFGGES